MSANQYKVLPVTSLNQSWFSVIVNQSEDKCRKSIDGTQIVLKLPETVQSVDDVPPEWVADYNANAPYLTHAQVRVEMAKAEWTADIE